MSGRFVRASSFRHVFGTEAKKNDQFLDLRPDITGIGSHITANSTYFAIACSGGGGPIAIYDQSKPGRQNSNPMKLAVHRGKCLDFAFNPFVDNMIATASDDCMAKVTQFPAGGLTENISEATAELEGHEKKVQELKWHPTSSNVLATASADCTVRTWDIEAQTETSIMEFADSPYAMDWNSNGSLLATVNKDKNLYVFDPRNNGAAQSVAAYAGTKQASVKFADNRNKIITVGFTRQSQRQMVIWDARNLEKSLHTVDIDQSAGVLITHYDPDNSIMYLGGKGDSGIKYFEIVDDKPYAHFLSEFRTNQSQKGLCFLPKKGLDTKKCEIARSLRLMRDSAVPISFTVPRKAGTFQKDLYPDTYAAQPAQDAAAWLAGKDVEAPKITMNPKLRGDEVKVEVKLVAKKSPAQLQKELDAANAKIAELEAELKKLKA